MPRSICSAMPGNRVLPYMPSRTVGLSVQHHPKVWIPCSGVGVEGLPESQHTRKKKMEKLRCYMPLPIFCAIISQKHLTSDRNTQPPRQSHQDSKHQPMLHRRANPHQETSLTHPSKSFSNLLSGSLPGHSESQVPFCVDSLVLFTPLRSNTASKTRAKTGKSKRNAKTNAALPRSRKKRRLSQVWPEFRTQRKGCSCQRRQACFTATL